MELLNSILYDTVYHSAPIILCVIGGIFAYKANVLNIALEGMMLNGAFVSVLVEYMTGSVAVAIIAAIVTTLLWGLLFSILGISCKGNVIVIGLGINLIVPAIAKFVLKMMELANISLQNVSVADFKINIPIIQDIPVIGNGDITCAKDVLRMQEETGCDGFMIGRRAKGNPWIFKEILHFFETGEEMPRPSLEEVVAMMLRHGQMMIDFKGEYIGVREMRKHVAWYTFGFPGAAKLREKVNHTETYEDLEELLQTYLKANPERD